MNKLVIILILFAFGSIFAQEEVQADILDTLRTLREKDDKANLIVQKDAQISQLTARNDSLQVILARAREFRETARVKFDSLQRENENLLRENEILLRRIENDKSERMNERWLASREVFERRAQEMKELEQNAVANKKFYLGLWGGGGTGFADFDGSFHRRFNGGFSASWQIGKVLALRSGIDWIRSEYIFLDTVTGYRGVDFFAQDTARAMKIPVLFEWAVRRGIVSVQFYTGAYFSQNLDGKAPGLTYGLDFGIKAWNGYGFLGFQQGRGIVEYDSFLTTKIGYSFGLATKRSFKQNNGGK